jgi:hypothetical protein
MNEIFRYLQLHGSQFVIAPASTLWPAQRPPDGMTIAPFRRIEHDRAFAPAAGDGRRSTPRQRQRHTTPYPAW